MFGQVTKDDTVIDNYGVDWTQVRKLTVALFDADGNKLESRTFKVSIFPKNTDYSDTGYNCIMHFLIYHWEEPYTRIMQVQGTDDGQWGYASTGEIDRAYEIALYDYCKYICDMRYFKLEEREEEYCDYDEPDPLELADLEEDRFIERVFGK